MNKSINILLFGGTTEGKATANWLHDMGFSYVYSTKTPTGFRVHGGCKKIEGALSLDAMKSFCQQHQIDCVIDAAHPYANELHENIHKCCKSSGLNHLRVERDTPQKTEQSNVIYVASLDEMIQYCSTPSFNRILSLMGVKSVGPLHMGLPDKQVWYRILDRELSWHEALAHGVEYDKILASSALDHIHDSEELIAQQQIDVLLTKDSGYNGLFDQKLELANKYKLPLVVLERPPMPAFDGIIKCRADLRQYMEKHFVLPKAELAHGYTSGTCATVCAKTAATLLLEGCCESEQRIVLPDGELVTMPIHTWGQEQGSAFATVIKNSGDDPDLMDGLVIGCRIKRNQSGVIRFVKGEGVGIVRLPGLQLPIGEPAINKVPRSMITVELEQLKEEYELLDLGFDVEVFIPQGKRLAQKTFNPRLGIEGGLSVIGSTGRIKPFSSEAYVNSIKRQLGVVNENGARHIVFNSGGRSERYLKQHFAGLPDHCFVQYGNYIGEALAAAGSCGIQQVSLGIMTGKAVKLAAGHLDTHSRKVVMDKDFIGQMVMDAGYPVEYQECIKAMRLARELEYIFEFNAEEPFFKVLKQRCHSVAASAGGDFQLQLILINNDGELID